MKITNFRNTPLTWKSNIFLHINPFAIKPAPIESPKNQPPNGTTFEIARKLSYGFVQVRKFAQVWMNLLPTVNTKTIWWNVELCKWFIVGRFERKFNKLYNRMNPVDDFCTSAIQVPIENPARQFSISTGIAFIRKLSTVFRMACF